ncbi:hypothetical protein [Gelidibacter salicanalis]|uniref:Uncharacterized protein n=1 Tax=Gelidibacter salicanalis TaxID=291193 RepID=A0A934KPJ3_9FLAO|nr:hypothetical protein [Gelidibacter salicanalis]MBJ7879770.1 hypothetical protein [Gelidibacter salicanalis]
MNRAEILKVSELPITVDSLTTQKEFSEALMAVSRLPEDEDKKAIWELNMGLRVFGWTHANNIPYLLYWLEDTDKKIFTPNKHSTN